MSRCVPANPVCSSTGTAQVAAVGLSKTVNIAIDPVCRTVETGADQTATPDPSN